jgi:hypothetical protein
MAQNNNMKNNKSNNNNNNNNSNSKNGMQINNKNSSGSSPTVQSTTGLGSVTSNIDQLNGGGCSTSPTSSTSPSSSIDSNPTYTTLSNSIINGTLTPPPDTGRLNQLL